MIRRSAPYLVALTLVLAGCSTLSTPITTTSTTTSTTVPTTATTLPLSTTPGFGRTEIPPINRISLTTKVNATVAPIMQTWIASYHHAVRKVTFQSSVADSGASIVDTANATNDIGSSGAVLPTAENASDPQLLNIPVAVSAVAVEFNLPGITTLRLTPTVLALIYEGLITNWNDPLIAKLNPKLTLPTETITTLHRSDGSAATDTFTQYLSQALPKSWGSPSGVGAGYLVKWPSLPQQKSASSNAAMVSECAATPGCITYVQTALSATAAATSTTSTTSTAAATTTTTLAPPAGQTLGQVQVQNPSGTFVLPTRQSVAAETRALPNTLPGNEDISLVSTSALNGYPLSNFEFAIVSNHQSGPVRAHALRSFLAWTLDPAHGGSLTLLKEFGLLALPYAVQQLSLSQVRSIGPKY